MLRHPRRPVLALLIVVLFAASLAGCGIKGPLVPPTPAAAAAPQADPAAKPDATARPAGAERPADAAKTPPFP
jgi:predicted small lipoprotein YifL